MKVLVAGGSGVVGSALLPTLINAGHTAIGLARSEDGTQRIRAGGADAVVVDALDGAALAAAVRRIDPEVVINQLTAIPQRLSPRRLARQFELTNRLRTEGTRNLLAAAKAADVRLYVAQSIAFAYETRGPAIKNEDASLYLSAPASFRPIVQAVADLETQTLEAGGVVLRYGQLYGPGTAYARDGDISRQIARRRLPIVGQGRGLFSFLHLQDAAAATVAALGQSSPGVYNVTHDEPGSSAEWITELASLLGAKPPRRVPAPVARLAAGRWAVEYMDQLRGASNALAKSTFGWEPTLPRWRDGFKAELAAP